MSFRDEPLGIKLYVILIGIAAIIFLILHIPEKLANPYHFIFFLILHIVLEHLDVPLPRGNGSVSVSFAVDLAVIILWGPEAAAWIASSTLFHLRTFRDFRTIGHKMLFNAFQMVISTGLAGYAYVLTGDGIGSIHLPKDIFPILITSAVFFMVNATLVMLAMSLSEKTSLIGMWLTNLRWSAPNYLATSPLGVLIATVYQDMQIAGVMLLIIPLMVARHTFIMYMDMRNQYISTIKALTKTIDAKDHYTHGHSERVARYTVWIGQEMRLQEDQLEMLEYLALMHDIGKIGIPEHILNKPSRLSDEEFQLVRDHAAVGAEILGNIRYIGEHADIVRHHHERVDGRGYPDGLTGDEMPLGAKIIGVADAYDAMTSDRVYRQPMSKEEAVQELLRCCNTQFDAKVVEALIRALRRKGEIR